MLEVLGYGSVVAAMVAVAYWAIVKVSGPLPQDFAVKEDVDEYKGAWYS